MNVKELISKFNKSINYLKKLIFSKIGFILLGLISTIWFLFRVIPKPSRASYPCMQASAPLMSGFILYLISLSGGVVAFQRMMNHLLKENYLKVFLFLMIFTGAGIVTIYISSDNVEAIDLNIKSNSPVGIPQGIHPGRVVWVWNPESTNEHCSNTPGDYWWEDKNTNQTTVDAMLDSAIVRIAGKETVNQAWDELFHYFNNKKHLEDRGYRTGEKIAIKINLTNSSMYEYDTRERMDQTPQLVLALLRHLVNEVGIDQADITVGDPYRKFQNAHYLKCYNVFPDVNYIDGHGQNGRVQTQPSSNHFLEFNNGEKTSSLPLHYLEADYLINLSCLKSHQSTGITLCAKNHMGSVLKQGDLATGQSAMYLHPYLPADNPGYGKYRQLVDFMGNEHLGGNTMLYLVDALWSGTGWEGFIRKWDMEPFNGDYTSSLFLSQDPVAIESVCYDFLLTENPEGHVTSVEGVNDYLLQAADSSYWPDNYVYKTSPEGAPLKSLGVYEHWNNSSDKQYSVNITGVPGSGIHLVSVPHHLVESQFIETSIANNTPDVVEKIKVYPNPVNNNSRLEFHLNVAANIDIRIYDLSGKTVKTLPNQQLSTGRHEISIGKEMSQIPAGFYIMKINGNFNESLNQDVMIIKN
ncbi:MAG: DUF362 domain-containing protein [Bacteroidota bacterium]